MPTPRTATFLFTDVEGSTDRWERAPESMREAIRRHLGFLREVIEAHGGRVFNTAGDGVCAAFPEAAGAVAAAIAAQRGILDGPEPSTPRLRSRMALHTGEAWTEDGDYRGPPVNRVARIVAAGHGGQILLGRSTAERVRGSLPPGARLRALGAYRLKGIPDPEPIHQLLAPGLPEDFPPLRASPVGAADLAPTRSPLVGRERDLERIVALLRDETTGILTLTGPGGVGKTRLALEVAAAVVDDFPGGVYPVALEGVPDPRSVPGAVARAIGIPESSERGLGDEVAARLSSGRTLLVLDNLEHLLEARSFVAEIVALCPSLVVLATTRVVLRLRNERVYEVPALEVPPDGLGTALALEFPAVRLFLDRARAARSDFHPAGAEIGAIAEICARLEGLPLALELAAARVRHLPPSAILERIRDRLDGLAGGAHDLPARQRTLRGAIAWSHDLLDARERRLFRRLSVFVGGFEIEAAEAVGGGVDPVVEDVLAALSSLIDHHLVRAPRLDVDPPRFTLFEAIRQYGLERLVETGELEAARAAHAVRARDLVEGVEPGLYGPDQAATLDRLERESGNFAEALGWSLGESRDVETGLRIVRILGRFWSLRGRLVEGRRWTDRALAAAWESPPEERGLLLHQAGVLARADGELDLAISLLEQSLALFGPGSDPAARARVGAMLGMARFDRALASGDFARAESIMTAVLEDAPALGPRGRVMPLINLGELARARDDLDGASAFYEEALALLEDEVPGAFEQKEILLADLALVAFLRGDLPAAERGFSDGLAMSLELGDGKGILYCLSGLAGVRGRQGRSALAARLLGSAEALAERRRLRFDELDRPFYDRLRDEIHRGLDPGVGEAARAAGRATPLDDAIARALEPDRPAAVPDRPSG